MAHPLESLIDQIIQSALPGPKVLKRDATYVRNAFGRYFSF